MITETLITPAQIKAYRPTADLDDARVTPFILEAQQNDLRPILNDLLYYDLMKRFTDSADAMYANYQNLINGVDYSYNGGTIHFSGIKPMLAYYALARFIVNNPINITRFGVVQKVNPQSEPISSAVINSVVNDLRSTAMNYQLDLVKFLETRSSVYPLYQTGGASSNIGTMNSFNFFRL